MKNWEFIFLSTSLLQTKMGTTQNDLSSLPKSNLQKLVEAPRNLKEINRNGGLKTS